MHIVRTGCDLPLSFCVFLVIGELKIQFIRRQGVPDRIEVGFDSRGTTNLTKLFCQVDVIASLEIQGPEK